MAKKKHPTPVPPCVTCGAKCCRYVASEIDEPTTKRDYDNIRWYLLHRNVNVFRDHDGDWYLEFETDCTALDEEYRCGEYANRPRICRSYGETKVGCQESSPDEPHELYFKTASEFEAYLDAQGIKWRKKKRK